jgi:hypothetical protein
MPGGRPLTRKKEAAIAALLSAGSLARAAEQAGIAERTLRNWLATAEFAQAYRRERQRLVEHAVGILQSASLQAVAALVRNLNCGRPGVEVSAANSLLERSTAAVETFDILTRLELLEQQQAGASHAYTNAQADGAAYRGTSP